MRMAEDVKGLLSSMQAEYENKLENKFSEVGTRLAMEHEERIRSLE